jgi:alpha-glucosidase
MLLLALPGPVFLYQGDELALPEVVLPDEALQDPVWERSGHTIRGRDGCRVPLPWSGTAPPYGFSPGTARPWLPMPVDWAELTVATQQTQAGSTWQFYRAALALRRQEPALRAGPLSWQSDGGDLLDFVRPHADGAVRCIVNFGPRPLPLPGADVLLASGDLQGDALPPDTAVWLRADS